MKYLTPFLTGIAIGAVLYFAWPGKSFVTDGLVEPGNLHVLGETGDAYSYDGDNSDLGGAWEYVAPGPECGKNCDT